MTANSFKQSKSWTRFYVEWACGLVSLSPVVTIPLVIYYIITSAPFFIFFSALLYTVGVLIFVSRK